MFFQHFLAGVFIAVGIRILATSAARDVAEDVAEDAVEDLKGQLIHKDACPQCRTAYDQAVIETRAALAAKEKK